MIDQHVPRFHLLRYFLTIILLAIPAVTGVAAFVTAHRFREELFDEAKDYAANVAESVYDHILRLFLDPVRKRGAYVDLLSDPAQLAQLEEVVELATRQYSVDRLYVFEPDGTISFSTMHEHIGLSMPPGNRYFESALRGEKASVVRPSGNPYDISRMPTGRELLETYVPVYSRDAGNERRLMGVVEVYQDIARLNEAAAKAGRRVAIVALVSMGILGGFLAIITVKANRVIRSREEEILSSNAVLVRISGDLERQVAERTNQLIQQEKLASVGTLAAGVAHEINNPLAIVAACAEGSLMRFAGDQLLPGQGTEVKAYLELITDEVYRCKRITGNLLEFSRQGPQVPGEDVDLDRLMTQSVELVRLAHDAAGVALELDLAADSRGVVGDPVQVRQVIHNLITNALAAVAKVKEPRILLRTRSTAGSVTLECIDNGPGIPAEIRDRIFEPFLTTKPAGKGTGLGLALCYSIAQRHRGTLQVLDAHLDPECVRGGWTGARIGLTLPRRTKSLETAGERR